MSFPGLWDEFLPELTCCTPRRLIPPETLGAPFKARWGDSVDAGDHLLEPETTGQGPVRFPNLDNCTFGLRRGKIGRCFYSRRRPTLQQHVHFGGRGGLLVGCNFVAEYWLPLLGFWVR